MAPEIGNGLLHAVVDHLLESRSPWRIGDGEANVRPLAHRDCRLETVVWDPRPQWSSIVVKPHGVQAVERIVAELAGRSRSCPAAHEALDRMLAQYIADLSWGHRRRIQRTSSGRPAACRPRFRAHPLRR